MLTFTITEKLDGYTYATATADNGAEIDVIVYDASTSDEWIIWVEVDDVRGVDYDVRSAIMAISYDGYMSIDDALSNVAYRIGKDIEHYC